MGTIVTPKEIVELLRFYLSGCPICGQVSSDKRYKRPYNYSTSTSKIYRCSKTSITMQCRNCGLRFNITWSNFVKMIGRLDDIARGKRRGDIRKRWKRIINPQEHIKLITRFFDISYGSRKSPSLQKR